MPTFNHHFILVKRPQKAKRITRFFLIYKLLMFNFQLCAKHAYYTYKITQVDGL